MMLRSSLAALSLSILSSLAAAQSSLSLVPSDPGDGTLWFRNLGGGGVADGSAQLGAHDIGPSTGPGTVAGLQWGSLAWNRDHLWFVSGSGTALPTSSEVLQLPAPPVPMAQCMGVATLNGGFIVTKDAAGTANLAVRPHLGALVWDQQALWAVECNGTVQVAGVLAGTVQGVCVLASRVEDVDPNPSAVDSHIVASALAFTSTGVYLVEVDFADGTIISSYSSVLDPSGAAIANTRGVLAVDSAFDSSVSPSDAQGAAYIWNDQHVWFFRHRLTADSIVELLAPGGAPIANCWGVMSLYSRAYTGALPANPNSKALVWTDAHAYVASSAPIVSCVEALDPGGAPLSTGVFVASNPFIKRQASGLWEIQGKNLLHDIRGMIIGHQQR